MASANIPGGQSSHEASSRGEGWGLVSYNAKGVDTKKEAVWNLLGNHSAADIITVCATLAETEILHYFSFPLHHFSFWFSIITPKAGRRIRKN